MYFTQIFLCSLMSTSLAIFVPDPLARVQEVEDQETKREIFADHFGQGQMTYDNWKRTC